jgi:hypothetical protein
MARGQDMQFGLDETDPARAQGVFPEQPAQASDTLARALGHYDADRFEQAAVMLQRVVEGTTGDGPAAAQQAQFFLAKAFVHLGFDHAALALLDEITHEGRAHPYFAQTLPWLARLSDRLEENGSALELMGRFEPAELGEIGSALDRETRARLLRMMGQHAYREGQLERAVALLAAVEPASSQRLAARFLEGVTHVRRHHVQPAVAAFREIVERVDAGQTYGAQDAERLRELAWLSLGRVYYTAGLATHDREREGELVGNAVHAWSQVSESSEHWPDALFESAWALYVSDEHARALGNLHALLSPFFRDAFYPEAHVLKAVLYFHACQMDNAVAALADFHQRYDGTRDQLRELLDHDPDGTQTVALLGTTAESAPSTKASPALAVLLGREHADREVLRALGELDALQRELQALEHAQAALRESSAGERIRQDVLVARSFAEAHARELALARAERLYRELTEVANQADTIEIEVLNYQRKKLGARPTMASAKGRHVEIDSEHQLWPFNGEYWRDELGYYRQEVSDHCDAR